METATPRALRIWPIEATVIPLPTEDTTPPVTKMYLASLMPLLSLHFGSSTTTTGSAGNDVFVTGNFAWGATPVWPISCQNCSAGVPEVPSGPSSKCIGTTTRGSSRLIISTALVASMDTSSPATGTNSTSTPARSSTWLELSG